MTAKQLREQGPTMSTVRPGRFDWAKTEWRDSESHRRWELRLRRIERRMKDLRAAQRRYRRRIGLPLEG